MWPYTQQFQCGHLACNCYVDSDLRYTHELFISLPYSYPYHKGERNIMGFGGSPHQSFWIQLVTVQINKSTDLSKLIPIPLHIKTVISAQHSLPPIYYHQYTTTNILPPIYYHQYTTTRENPSLVGHLKITNFTVY